jgi:hypothetical protein
VKWAKWLIVVVLVVVIGYPLVWYGQQLYVMLFVPERQPVLVEQGKLTIGSSTGIRSLTDIYQRDTYTFTVDHEVWGNVRLETTTDSQFMFLVKTSAERGEVGYSTASQGKPASVSIHFLPGVTYQIIVIPVYEGNYQLWLECKAT